MNREPQPRLVERRERGLIRHASSVYGASLHAVTRGQIVHAWVINDPTRLLVERRGRAVSLATSVGGYDESVYRLLNSLFDRRECRGSGRHH